MPTAPACERALPGAVRSKPSPVSSVCERLAPARARRARRAPRRGRRVAPACSGARWSLRRPLQNFACRGSRRRRRAPPASRRSVELEREALLEAIALVDVEGSMPFSDSLASTSARPALAAILPRGRAPRRAAARAARPSRARRAGTPPPPEVPPVKSSGAHLLQRQHAHQVRGAAHRAAVDLGQREVGVVGREDHVARAADADAAAEHEAVHGGDHRHPAVVDGAEGRSSRGSPRRCARGASAAP